LRVVLIMGLMGLLVLASACGGGKPEEQLAKHMNKIADIMENHTESPEDGVKELESYVQSNGPEMAEQMGKLIVEIDKMEDEEAMKTRIEEITKTLKEPMERMQKVGPSFEKAMKGDDAAKKYIEDHVVKRFAVLKDVLPIPMGP